MSIDSRFSETEFASRGRNSDGAEQLSAKLQTALAQELQQELQSLGKHLVKLLAEVGHQMNEIDSEVDDGRASITLADLRAGTDRAHHLLRCDLDLIVSVGYPGYVDG